MARCQRQTVIIQYKLCRFVIGTITFQLVQLPRRSIEVNFLLGNCSENIWKDKAMGSAPMTQETKRWNHRWFLPGDFGELGIAQSFPFLNHVTFHEFISGPIYYRLSIACLHTFSLKTLHFNFVRVTVLNRPKFRLAFPIFMLTVIRLIVVA